MTELQKKTIKKMRRELISYSVIAKEIGMSTNTVKSFCFRNGLHTSVIQNYNGKCACCGKQLPSKKTRPRKFCSPACKVKYWRKNRVNDSEKLIQTKCAVCGKTIFDYESAHRKYCSRECFLKRGEIV